MNRPARDVERFDRWASTYDQHYLQRLVFTPVQKTLLQIAVAERPDATAILDVGCGTGRLLRAAAELYPDARLVGVDAAPEMIRNAQAGDARATFHVATAEQLPLGDAEFDLVFSTMTLHHWADQQQGIAEIARVLRPWGLWLLAEFFPRGVLRLVMSRRFPRRPVFDRQVAAAGLEVVSQRPVVGLGGQVSIVVSRTSGVSPD